MNIFAKIWDAGVRLAQSMNRLADSFNALADQVDNRFEVDKPEVIEHESNGVGTHRLPNKAKAKA